MSRLELTQRVIHAETVIFHAALEKDEVALLAGEPSKICMSIFAEVSACS